MSSLYPSELTRSSAPEDDVGIGSDGPSAEVRAVTSGGPIPEVYRFPLDEELIDPDAAKVVRRLTRHGHEAYLVGGCVRDLLVDRRPKDFDVATSARPDDVRRLFRNSRIIGRRFRLVHVLFGGGKVIETATFRRAPEQTSGREGDDLLIRNDNVFGDAHEDAQRRDFTINGLFYDIERREVIDWVGGMPDIERRSVHTIGNPVVRFLEDPVRILRAVKFSARLDFGLSPDVYDAIVSCRHALRRAAKPRLFEEMLRLMREGAAHRSLWIAWETGVLDVLLPELSTHLADREESDDVVWRMLSEIDRRVVEGTAFDDTLLWLALLLEPMREACAGDGDRVQAAHEFLEPIVDRLNVPRRIADPVRRVIAMLPRVESGRLGRFARSALYPLAVEITALRNAALAAESPPPSSSGGPASMAPGSASAAPVRRRKRRRRRTRE
jgi:poly(A) polymerase